MSHQVHCFATALGPRRNVWHMYLCRTTYISSFVCIITQQPRAPYVVLHTLYSTHALLLPPYRLPYRVCACSHVPPKPSVQPRSTARCGTWQLSYKNSVKCSYMDLRDAAPAHWVSDGLTSDGWSYPWKKNGDAPSAQGWASAFHPKLLPTAAARKLN